MARNTKIGSPLGVTEWQALDSSADVKRFLRWCILSVRDQAMDTRTAATLGQLACYLLKATETADLEKRLVDIEARLLSNDTHHDVRNPTTTH